MKLTVISWFPLTPPTSVTNGIGTWTLQLIFSTDSFCLWHNYELFADCFEGFKVTSSKGGRIIFLLLLILFYIAFMHEWPSDACSRVRHIFCSNLILFLYDRNTGVFFQDMLGRVVVLCQCFKMLNSSTQEAVKHLAWY